MIEDGLGILLEQLVTGTKVSKRICLLVAVTVKREKHCSQYIIYTNIDMYVV